MVGSLQQNGLWRILFYFLAVVNSDKFYSTRISGCYAPFILGLPKSHFPKISLSLNPTFSKCHSQNSTFSNPNLSKSHFLKIPLPKTRKILLYQNDSFSKDRLPKFHIPKNTTLDFPKIPLSQNPAFPKSSFPRIPLSQNLTFPISTI